MKCIQCGTDNKLRDRLRLQGRCKNCGHEFAFEPTTASSQYLAKITDTFFQNAMVSISVNNSLYFTPKQFFYFLNRKVKSNLLKINGRRITTYIVIVSLITFALGNSLYEDTGNSTVFFEIAGTIGFLIMGLVRISSSPNSLTYQQLQRNGEDLSLLGGFISTIGVAISLVVTDYGGLLISTLVGLLGLYWGRVIKKIDSQLVETLPVDEAQFEKWLSRWENINGKIERMLVLRESDTPTPINPDITAYSFDRLIVCDSADTAQFLIANNFHFENNCAILSITGYPQSIFNTTMEMLRRNPELKVYALHDCTSNGLELIHCLRTSPAWFQNSNVAIIDIGIYPRQVLATKKGIFTETSPQSATDAKQLIPEIRQELAPEELQWLEAGNIVNLESFQPQKLIQIIQRKITNTQILESDDLRIIDSSNNNVYTTESFG
jgi:hypothetical protein